MNSDLVSSDPKPGVETNTWGRVLSASPLVTFSMTGKNYLAGMAGFSVDLLEGRRALHLLHHSWTLEQGHAVEVAEAIAALKRDLPRSEFLMLCSNDVEVLHCAREGLPAMLGSGLIFTDERIWYPRAPEITAARHDAVYLARLDALKRHALAAGIDSLLLIYGPVIRTNAIDSLARVRKLLPSATYANDDAGGGVYRKLEPNTVAQLFSDAKVGLCLSAVEGCMRASMEYLLSGLPIVSTKSVGGRDRYFGNSYCRVVGDDPSEIGHAVQQLANLNLDRQRIREHVGQMLSFDRYNFLLSLNAYVRKMFGTDYDLFQNFAPFVGTVSNYFSIDGIRDMFVQSMR